MPIPYMRLFGKDFLAITYDLTDAQVGKLIKIMCRFSIGLDVSVPENLKKHVEMLKKNLDDDIKKYNKKCEQNQSASNARWKPDAIQMQSRCNPNQNQNQNQNKDKEKNTKKESLPLSLCDFEEFWKAYPKKTGKQKAQTCYQSALKKTSHATIMHGLSRYNEYIRINKTEDKYIKTLIFCIFPYQMPQIAAILSIAFSYSEYVAFGLLSSHSLFIRSYR